MKSTAGFKLPSSMATAMYAVIACLLILTIPSLCASAAKPVDGDSCSGYPANSFMWSGGPEDGGLLYGLWCNGGTGKWKAGVMFQSSGKVALGTTTAIPSTGPQLYMTGSCNGGTACGEAIYNIQAAAGGAGSLTLQGSGGVNSSWSFSSTTSVSPAAKALSYNTGVNVAANLITASANPIVFMTAGTASTNERARIDSAGNVGIGTTSPQAMLDVSGYIRLAINTAQPAACTSTIDRQIALTHIYTLCVCKGASTSWVLMKDGTTACSW